MWKQDAKAWLQKKAVHTSRAIYGQMLHFYPKKWKIWWDAALLEKNHGTSKNTAEILTQATILSQSC
eukprot:UN28970